MKPENGEQNPPNKGLDGDDRADDQPGREDEPVVVPRTTLSPINRLLRWIRSFESTFLPLFFLWFLGVVWALFEMVRTLPELIKPEDAGGFTNVFIFLITVQLGLGLAHQFIVFRCIHVFDTDKRVWEPRFPNWIGTTAEWTLRAFILFSLLAVGGEIPLLTKHIRDAVQADHNHLHEIPLHTYPACSVALYSLLVLWDVWGGLRVPAPPSRRAKIWNLIWPARPLTLRQVYFYSDLLCLIFWLALLWCTKDGRIGIISFSIVLLTAILFVRMTIHRVISHVRGQTD